MPRSHLRSWFSAAFFLALTLLFTYPLWTAPDRLLPDLFDARLTAWIMAWDAHALVDGSARLFDANIFHPHARTLAYSENLLGSALLAAPLNWAGQTILAHNLVFLSSFLLSGLAMMLWVQRLVGSWTAGLVAGLVWTFAPTKTDHLAHIQLLTSMWIPLTLYVLTIYVQTRRRGLVVVAAALLGWQYWTGIQATLVMLPLVGLYFVAAWRHRQEPRAGEGRRLLREAFPAAAVLLLMVVPLSVPYLQVSADEGFTRTLGDTQQFAARPLGFLAGSWANRASHMAAAHRRFGKPEGNHGLGVLGSLLFAIAVLLAFQEVRSRSPGRGRPDPAAFGARRPTGWTRLRGHVHTAAVGVAILATALHLAGVLAATLGPAEGTAAGFVTGLSSALDPALWMALAGTLVVFTVGRPVNDGTGTGSSPSLLWLAGLGYLLALGPTVVVGDTVLGSAPFGLLYDWAVPYRSMRAVGRFGLAWLLFVAPLIGIAVDAMTARLTAASGSHRLRLALLLAVVAAMAAEYRTWPLEPRDARLAEPEVYQALAELPGKGAVLHLPMRPGNDAPRATEYMFGSTRHWRPLVNGYSGFLPGDVARLIHTSPTEPGFWEFLRAEFPVDHVVIHGRLLDRERFGGLVEQMRHSNPDLHEVRSLGDSVIFRVDPGIERDRLIRRRFSARRLRQSRGLSFDVRSLGAGVGSPVEDSVQVLWAGTVAGHCPLGDAWTRCEVLQPEGWEAQADGSGTIQIWNPPPPGVARPLGRTTTPLTTELFVDAQLNRLAFARDDLWERVHPTSGALVAELNLGGRRLLRTMTFPASDEGMESLHDFLDQEVSDGHIVALALHLLAPTPSDRARATTLAAALRLVGATGELPENRWVHAILGVKGAAAGEAVEDHSLSWASVRAGLIDYPGARIAVRDFRLEE